MGLPVAHYLRMILYRKWIVAAIFLIVSGGIAVYTWFLPNIYTSDTLILVDPQKVPESYVKSTVTGDIRNRLGTLSNQILSATRLQKIIDALNLYPEERKKMAREDVISKMRGDISTNIVSDFGGSQDLQAFRIVYSGQDPRLVAQVTNQLATLFIDENLNARTQQATGTTEFLGNQLQETRKALEGQENQLKEFRLKHIGEMPEQQTANLQILGTLQAQLQLEGEALSRAEGQKSVLESAMTQSEPVVDIDSAVEARTAPSVQQQQAASSRPQRVDPLAADRALLAQQLTHLGPNNPDVRRLKNKIDQEEAQAKGAAPGSETAVIVPAPPSPPKPQMAVDATNLTRTEARVAPAQHYNPVVQAQIRSAEAEIARHKDEQQRLAKLVNGYRTRLDAIPVNEQAISSLTRDYEMSKAHYGQLLERELSAETATQLEIRQKGEKFEVLDSALPAERPTSPKRPIYYAGGVIAGLLFGILGALATEVLGMSITESQDVMESAGVDVLGVIPVILTQSDKMIRRRRLVVAASSATFAVLVVGLILFLKMHGQV
jgi:succinoglycan biosynthesis transport protein ExoP